MESGVVSQVSYDEREENGWTIWSISGSLDINTSLETEEQGQKIYASAEKMAVDLSGIKYISSAGLRILMRFGKRAKKDGKEFALVAAKGMAVTVLKEAKMDMMVPVLPSCKELESVGMSF